LLQPIGDAFEGFCEHIDATAISERRFRDKLNDLAAWGILAKTTKGRGQGLGKTNRYELAVKAETVLDNLADESRIENISQDMLRPKME